MDDTPYVIVVHGTWNPPQEGKRRWYQVNEADPDNFCTRLNERLAELGFGRPVGRSLDKRTIEFAWTGANNHDARMEAARRLHALIKDIADQDASARIHLIAHSHGGNVALKAIQEYLDLHCELAERAYDDWRFEIDEDWWSLFIGPHDPNIRWDQVEPFFSERAVRPDGTTETTASRFIADWLADPRINRLGRVVFLGTPFYWKRWPKRGAIERFLRRFLSVALNTTVLGTLFYLSLVIFWLIGYPQRFLSGEPSRIALDVTSWSWTAWVMFAAAILPVAWWATPRRPRDANLYFDEERLSRVIHADTAAPASGPIDALIVEAGVLDEALLALSSEPLVYGALVPRLKDLLQGRKDWDLPKPPAGMQDIKDRLALRELRYLAVLAVRRTLAWICTPILRPARAALEAYLISTIVKLVSAAACGMRPLDFSEGRLEVRSTPNIRFLREHRWNAAQLLLSRHPAASKPSAAADSTIVRYGFLWDERVMAEKLDKNEIWPHIVEFLPHMRRRYANDMLSWSEHVAVLKAISVTVVERLREFAGAVELAHSQYYTNPEVIDEIARFLATGRSEFSDRA
ncbi:hypothetical protein JQ625_23280 [Bradyrhizobium diazoefficiens]|nr:hypothetical protein [Bradyrhizobium diazoefficiens]MBR0777768.1 hypothetical protein [Bradyrhizobium diazoefficiens]